MKISIITLFPGMIQGFVDESIIKRAVEKGTVSLEFINLRAFATDNYGTVDDRPYGGGAGMVLKIEPISKAMAQAGAYPVSTPNKRRTIMTSPRGIVYNQKIARDYAALEHLVLFAGHYEGVDERALQLFDDEISLGDYVLTGGEIAVAAIIDSVVRLLPGALKKTDATDNESFFEVHISDLIKVVGEDDTLHTLQAHGIQSVKLLEYPHYTRPDTFNGESVPEVLLNGNHKDIDRWRMAKAYEVTLHRRPDLLRPTH